MKEGLWLGMSDGTQEFVLYEDLDTETTKKLLRPVGGFCYKAEAFCKLPLPNPPFYIMGWLPVGGRLVIYAPSKSGKSWLAMQIARRIALGLPLLPAKPSTSVATNYTQSNLSTTLARTLIIQCELSPVTYQGRLKSHTNPNKPYSNMFLGNALDLKIDTARGQDLLERALTEIDPRVLILDPLYKTHTADENDTKEMKLITDYLDYLIENYNLSIVLIHHAGKDITKGGRGSSILEGYPDTVLELKRTSKLNEPLRARLTPKLLRHCVADTPHYDIELQPDLMEFCLIGDKAGAKPETIRERLISRLEGEENPIRVVDLVKEKLGSRRGIIDALDQLQDEGRVVKIERGLYQWDCSSTAGCKRC